MLQFDLVYENQGILAQALSDLVENLFIGIGSLDDPFTTDQKLENLDASELERLAETVAARLGTRADHRDLDGIRSGRLNTVAVVTSSLMQKFKGEMWSDDVDG